MNLHRILLIFIVAAVSLCALVTILQIWVPIMDWDNYLKFVITVGILVLLAAFVLMVKADLGQHKKLKDDNYLD